MHFKETVKPIIALRTGIHARRNPNKSTPWHQECIKKDILSPYIKAVLLKWKKMQKNTSQTVFTHWYDTVDLCCFNRSSSEVWFQLFHSILKALNFMFYRKPGGKNKIKILPFIYWNFFSSVQYYVKNMRMMIWNRTFLHVLFSKVETILIQCQKEKKN